MRMKRRRQGESVFLSIVTMCLFASLWMGCGSESEIATAQAGRTSDEIINGTPTTTSYANVISIRAEGRHWCTGMIVGYNAVLTALHCDCLLDVDRSNLRFRRGNFTNDGQQDLTVGSNVVQVADVFTPYSCAENGTQEGKDVMMLITDPPIGAVSGIDRNPSDQKQLHDYAANDGDQFTIVGYGRTVYNELSPGEKKTAQQQLLEVAGEALVTQCRSIKT